MNEEARRALTRFGVKARAILERADMLDSLEWDSMLFDITVIERTFMQLETDNRIDVGKAIVMATEEQILRGKREAENDALMALLGSAGNDLLTIYGKMMEPLRERYAEKMADQQSGRMSRKEVYDKFEELDELLDTLVATLIDNGPLLYRGTHPQEGRVREIMRRVIVPSFVRIVAELEKSRGESNRLYGIGQEYDADSKEMRALLWDAHRDIMEWVRIAKRIRKEIEDPEHTPWCPHERGIQESVDLASRICAKAREGQGDAKN